MNTLLIVLFSTMLSVFSGSPADVDSDQYLNTGNYILACEPGEVANLVQILDDGISIFCSGGDSWIVTNYHCSPQIQVYSGFDYERNDLNSYVFRCYGYFPGDMNDGLYLPWIESPEGGASGDVRSSAIEEVFTVLDGNPPEIEFPMMPAPVAGYLVDSLREVFSCPSRDHIIWLYDDIETDWEIQAMCHDPENRQLIPDRPLNPNVMSTIFCYWGDSKQALQFTQLRPDRLAIRCYGAYRDSTLFTPMLSK